MLESPTDRAPETHRVVRPDWVKQPFERRFANAVWTRFSGGRHRAPAAIAGLQLTHPAREFYTCWRGARGSKMMPAPDDMRPGDFKPLLPYVFCLEWKSAEALVFRVAGGAITESFGGEIAGFNVYDFAVEGEREADMRRARRQHSQPCGVLAIMQFVDLDDIPHFVELLYLPVSAAPGGGDRLIGTIMPYDPDYSAFTDLQRTRSVGYGACVYFDIGAGLPEGQPDLIPPSTELLMFQHGGKAKRT